jgi:hypothetical protein
MSIFEGIKTEREGQKEEGNRAEDIYLMFFGETSFMINSDILFLSPALVYLAVAKLLAQSIHWNHLESPF